MEEVQDLLAELLVSEWGGILEGNSDELLQLNLKFCEKIANIFQQTIPVAELAAMMPEELRNEETADILRANNANTLADIATFKPA